MGGHYHPRRRRAGWISVIRAEGASKVFGFRKKRPGPPRHSQTEEPEPWLTRDLARGKNALLPTGKSVTNSLWCWQFLASKVGSFLASAEAYGDRPIFLSKSNIAENP